jgi:hypothetical protein
MRSEELSLSCCASTPHSLFDPRLSEMSRAAVLRVCAELRQKLPYSAEEAVRWLGSLAESDSPEDCFRGGRAHILLFPWFLETSIRRDPDPDFQQTVVYSSVNGYYFVRLLDNVMDGHRPEDARLLPLSGFFHNNFQGAYTTYFDGQSPFWKYFSDVWADMADATVAASHGEESSGRISPEFTARKIGAVKIPLAAVCFRYSRPDLMAAWGDCFDGFACFHEMLDDFVDWHQDLSSGRPSYVLQEAERRRRPGESVAAYMIRDGLAWGFGTLTDQFQKARELAGKLDSAALVAYLDYRFSEVENLWRTLEPDLRKLESLADAFGGSSDGER